MSNSSIGGRPATQRLGAIEAGRGIAATAVVLYHAARHLDKAYGTPWLMSVFQFGHAGVDMFFVISGFIILYVHYDDIGAPARLGHYAWRRFTRVMPTYWVALALTVLLHFGGSRGLPPAADLICSASLLPCRRELVLGIAWTLQYEVLFYVIFCILILHRGAGIAVLMAWLAGIALLSGGIVGAGPLPAVFHDTYNLEFFFGMAAAWCLRTRDVGAPRRVLALGAVLFAAAALAEDLHVLDGHAAPARFAYGLPAALIVLGAAAADRRNPLAVPRPLKTLGRASYAIYLFQFVAIGILWKLWLAARLDHATAHWASFPLLALGGVAGGIFLSWSVEYPLIGLVRHRRGRIEPLAVQG